MWSSNDDAIKLKNGISWNSMNNKVTGFVHDEFNTTTMLKNILGLTNSKLKTKKQLVVYSNQWRFRSTIGVTHNANIYYNCGSLDTNEITCQFIDILTSYYELIGISNLGVIGDRGSNNE